MKKIHDMGVPPQQPPQPTNEQIKAAFEAGKLIECDTNGCHGKVFLPAMAFKNLSRIALGTSEDKQMPLEILVCARCGAVMDDINGEFK